jgi:hypothetical protein
MRPAPYSAIPSPRAWVPVGAPTAKAGAQNNGFA